MLQTPGKAVTSHQRARTRRIAMLKPVLLILHQEHSSPGRVGQTLAKLGYPLDIRRPRFGDPLPETMDEHAGAAIFGGPQSANDNEEFRAPRDRLDRRAAARQEALSRHLPWRADDGASSRRPGVSTSARPCRGRLLSDPSDRGWTQGLRGMARPRLSMAPRRFRPAVRQASCWPRATPSPFRRSGLALATHCNFTPKSRTR